MTDNLTGGNRENGVEEKTAPTLLPEEKITFWQTPDATLIALGIFGFLFWFGIGLFFCVKMSQ